MDGLLPWQRQLYECERLICQRDAVLSEVRGLGVVRGPLPSMYSWPSPAPAPRSGKGSPGWVSSLDKQPREVRGFPWNGKPVPAGSGNLMLSLRP